MELTEDIDNQDTKSSSSSDFINDSAALSKENIGSNYAKSGKRDDDIVGEITRPSSYSVVLNAVVSKDLNGDNNNLSDSVESSAFDEKGKTKSKNATHSNAAFVQVSDPMAVTPPCLLVSESYDNSVNKSAFSTEQNFNGQLQNPDNAPSSTTVDVDNRAYSSSRLNEFKVHDLKAECKKRQLAVSGSKFQILERLRPFEDAIVTEFERNSKTICNKLLSSFTSTLTQARSTGACSFGANGKRCLTVVSDQQATSSNFSSSSIDLSVIDAVASNKSSTSSSVTSSTKHKTASKEFFFTNPKESKESRDKVGTVRDVINDYLQQQFSLKTSSTTNPTCSSGNDCMWVDSGTLPSNNTQTNLLESSTSQQKVVNRINIEASAGLNSSGNSTMSRNHSRSSNSSPSVCECANCPVTTDSLRQKLPAEAASCGQNKPSNRQQRAFVTKVDGKSGKGKRQSSKMYEPTFSFAQMGSGGQFTLADAGTSPTHESQKSGSDTCVLSSATHTVFQYSKGLSSKKSNARGSQVTDHKLLSTTSTAPSNFFQINGGSSNSDSNNKRAFENVQHFPDSKSECTCCRRDEFGLPTASSQQKQDQYLQESFNRHHSPSPFHCAKTIDAQINDSTLVNSSPQHIQSRSLTCRSQGYDSCSGDCCGKAAKVAHHNRHSISTHGDDGVPQGVRRRHSVDDAGAALLYGDASCRGSIERNQYHQSFVFCDDNEKKGEEDSRADYTDCVLDDELSDEKAPHLFQFDVSDPNSIAKTLSNHEETLRNQQKKIRELQRELACSQQNLRHQQQMIWEAKKALVHRDANGCQQTQAEYWLTQLNVKKLSANFSQNVMQHKFQQQQLQMQITDHRQLVSAEQKLQEQLHVEQAVEDIVRIIQQDSRAALLIVQLLRRYQLERSNSGTSTSTCCTNKSGCLSATSTTNNVSCNRSTDILSAQCNAFQQRVAVQSSNSLQLQVQNNNNPHRNWSQQQQQHGCSKQHHQDFQQNKVSIPTKCVTSSSPNDYCLSTVNAQKASVAPVVVIEDDLSDGVMTGSSSISLAKKSDIPEATNNFSSFNHSVQKPLSTKTDVRNSTASKNSQSRNRPTHSRSSNITTDDASTPIRAILAAAVAAEQAAAASGINTKPKLKSKKKALNGTQRCAPLSTSNIGKRAFSSNNNNEVIPSKRSNNDSSAVCITSNSAQRLSGTKSSNSVDMEEIFRSVLEDASKTTTAASTTNKSVTFTNGGDIGGTIATKPTSYKSHHTTLSSSGTSSKSEEYRLNSEFIANIINKEKSKLAEAAAAAAASGRSSSKHSKSHHSSHSKNVSNANKSSHEASARHSSATSSKNTKKDGLKVGAAHHKNSSSFSGHNGPYFMSRGATGMITQDTCTSGGVEQCVGSSGKPTMQSSSSSSQHQSMTNSDAIDSFMKVDRLPYSSNNRRQPQRQNHSSQRTLLGDYHRRHSMPQQQLHMDFHNQFSESSGYTEMSSPISNFNSSNDSTTINTTSLNIDCFNNMSTAGFAVDCASDYFTAERLVRNDSNNESSLDYAKNHAFDDLMDVLRDDQEKSLLGLTTTTPPKEDFTLGYTSDELINFLADDSFENADNFCASQSCSMMFRSNNNISLLHNGSSGASGGPKLNHSYGVSLSAPNSNESVPVEVGTSGPDYRSRGNGVGSISNFYQGPRHNNSYLQQQPHFERNVGESNYDSIETELSPFHHQKNNSGKRQLSNSIGNVMNGQNHFQMSNSENAYLMLHSTVNDNSNGVCDENIGECKAAFGSSNGDMSLDIIPPSSVDAISSRDSNNSCHDMTHQRQPFSVSSTSAASIISTSSSGQQMNQDIVLNGFAGSNNAFAEMSTNNDYHNKSQQLEASMFDKAMGVDDDDDMNWMNNIDTVLVQHSDNTFDAHLNSFNQRYFSCNGGQQAIRPAMNAFV